MKLAKIDITNFRCFESLSIPLRPDVNVFVGINGSGKTTILDAVAIALFDIVAANGGGKKHQRSGQGVALRPSDIHTQSDGKQREFVQISAQASQYYPLLDFPSKAPNGEEKLIEWTDYIQYRLPNSFSYDTSKSERLDEIYRYFAALWQEIRHSDAKALIPLPVVAYYRTSRRLAQMPKMGDIFSVQLERYDAFQNALDAGSDYQAMCQWFYLRENDELREKLQVLEDRGFEFPDLKAVRNALKRSLDQVNRIFFDGVKLKVELSGEGDALKNFEIEQLSDGYRNLLAITLDFSRRLAQAHPYWDNPLEAPGILLIDEIELHLHPGWQQRIIPNLRSIFPNTQLMIATHSPQVLTTVKRENIFILKDNKLYSAPINPYGSESSRAMNLVMQTDSRPPENEVVNKFHQLLNLINQESLKEASILHDELARQWDSDEPALIEAQMMIKNREWEKELGL
jgi:predicted ATP-binding protein involved in virulence